MKISESQKKAIEHFRGPMMVLAGPGSGKTFVITNRIGYLMEQRGIHPENILVITFTKASAGEMKERFLKLAGPTGAKVNFGTFHAIFFTVLKHAYHYTGDNIIRGDVKQQYLREIVEKYKLELDDEKELISQIESEISAVKGEMMDIQNYFSTSCAEETFRNIFLEYQRKLHGNKLIDFDDMIIECYRLFEQRPDILKQWQDKFQYILIDEFQDINLLQYSIVKMLARPNNNLFIVGDDDQSIYGFRGSKPEIMLNFDIEFPNAQKVILDINYRSSQCIVESASKVIKNNRNRFPKQIGTINEEGETVRIVEFRSVFDESIRVTKEIMDKRADGVLFSQIAILYRTNTQPRSLIGKLMEFNIPFSLRDSIPSLYDHWISKNIMDYIKGAMELANSRRISRGILLRIVNRPNRYIGRDSLKDLDVDLEDVKEYYSDKDWMVQRLDKLEYDLMAISKMKPYTALNYIRNAVGYDEYLRDYAVQKRIGEEELFEILNELTEGTKEYETFDDWFKAIEKYEIKLREQLKKSNVQKESVTLTTFHGSKGLEFDAVFIIDANEGITPHKKALSESDLEEERRMFYVAMTRARHSLFICYVKERFKQNLEVSRYIGEIFVDKSMLVKGIRIVHHRYGKGVIVSRKENKITIQFEKIVGNKILDIDYCVGNRMITMEE